MIKWKEREEGQRYIEAEGGRWRISGTARRRKTKLVMVYQLWRKDGDKWPMLGFFDTAESAKIKAAELAQDDNREEV